MAKKETTVENKLRSLFDLQLIDSRIDQIRSVRGELPLEVEDLENEIQGLQTQLDTRSKEIARQESLLSDAEHEAEKMRRLYRLKIQVYRNYSLNQYFYGLWLLSNIFFP